MNFDSDKYLILPKQKFSLKDLDPADTQGLDDKKAAEKLCKNNIKQIVDLQSKLYAEKKQSLLLVLQAMDTAGKDSTIRSITKGLNPQSCTVASFKKPTDKELAQDFLWRVHHEVPAKGQIKIFNRSHYEDVLVVRVHKWIDKQTTTQRYKQINDFEQLLYSNGTRIIKVMLNISKDYQLGRLRRRLERPQSHWKFNPGDLAERKHWSSYMECYEQMILHCSKKNSPWHVIPAEKRWFRDLVITNIILKTLEEMNPQFPKPNFKLEDYPPESLV